MTDYRDKEREKSRQRALYSEEWWAEHLEAEHENALAADLNLLLENSPADRRVLKSLEQTRSAVKDAGDVYLPESGEFYQSLHDKIMAAIDEEIAPVEHIETSIKSKLFRIKQEKFGFQSIVKSLMTVLVVTGGTLLAMRATQPFLQQQSSANFEHEMERTALEHDLAANAKPQFIASSMVGYQNESDVVNEALLHRIDNLDAHEVDALFHTLRQ